VRWRVLGGRPRLQKSWLTRKNVPVEVDVKVWTDIVVVQVALVWE
jgi:hypothetical protein